MRYTDRVVISSELPDFKGVTFTLHKISHGIRSKIRQQLAPALADIREKTEQINNILEEGGFNDKESPAPDTNQGILPLSDDPSAPEPITPPAPVAKKDSRFTQEQVRLIEKIGDINNEIEIITVNRIDIVYLQHGFISISNFDIETADGKVIEKPNYKDLYEHGPEYLCKEIVAAIKAQAGLTVPVKENLESPITSGAAADGRMSDSIAPNANDTGDGSKEIVVSISQST